MSMTRDEALKWFERRIMQITMPGARAVYEAAIRALRPVSRERIEQVWRGEWNYSHTTETDHFAVVKCPECGHEAFAIALYVKDGNFCPACGAPMTDEAVDILLKRLEVLHENIHNG